MLKELCSVIKWCVTGLQDYFNIQKVINVIHHVKSEKAKTESDQSMQKIYLIKVHTHS